MTVTITLHNEVIVRSQSQTEFGRKLKKNAIIKN